MKLIDVKSNSYAEYKTIFAKEYTPNWSEEVFVIRKIKNTVTWNYLIMILMVKKLLELFMKKKLQETNERIWNKKVIKRKGNRLYVKRKDYDNSFNRCISKKDIV